MVRNASRAHASLVIAIVMGGISVGTAPGHAQTGDVQIADVVYEHARIYTGDPMNPWAEAVAVAGGRFIRVGSYEEAEEHYGDHTEIVDLGGYMALPGIIDLHVHPFTTALFHRLGVDFSDNRNHDAMMRELRQYAAAHPEKAWIRGGAWALGVYPDDNPSRTDLDAVVPDRPVILIDETGHSYWCNSRALELAGITSDTESTAGHVVEKDPTTGEPTGTLRELALRRVERVADQPTPEEWVAVEGEIMAEFARNGVTAMQTAEASRAPLDALLTLEARGELPLRVFAAWDWHQTPITPLTDPELDAQINDRGIYRSERLRSDYVKIYADGMPAGHGAQFVAGYADIPGEFGHAYLTPEEMRHAVAGFDAAGVGCVVHAIGDAATRHALNAIEYARRENDGSRTRHKVSHLTWMRTLDVERLPRIKGVAAEFSPGLLHDTPGSREALVALVGEERLEFRSPVASLVRTGVPVGYGSDWLTTAPISPWPQMQSFITRENPDHPDLGVQNERDTVTLEEAIRIFTWGGAYAVGADDELGTIEVGKHADMVVIDQHLFEIPARRIGQTKVVYTISGGDLVYDRERDGR